MAGLEKGIGARQPHIQRESLTELKDNKDNTLPDKPVGNVFTRAVRQIKNALPSLNRKRSINDRQPVDTALTERKVISRPFALDQTGDLSDIHQKTQVLLKNKHIVLSAVLALVQKEIEKQKERVGRIGLRINLAEDADAISDKIGKLVVLEQEIGEIINSPDSLSLNKNDEIIHAFEEVRRLPDVWIKKIADLLQRDRDDVKTEFNNQRLAIYTSIRKLKETQSSASEEAVSTHSYQELYDLQEVVFSSAVNVARQGAQTAKASGQNAQAQKLNSLADALTQQLHSIEQSIALKGRDEAVSPKDAKDAKNLPKFLQQQLVKAGLPKDLVKATFHRAQAGALNKQGWDAFHKEFEDPSGGGRFSSDQIPACEMSSAIEGQEAREIFRVPYIQGAGVACADTSNAEHATNLWKSNFSINSKKVFNGIRHGILDAPGIKSALGRSHAAEKKAEEALIASLASKPGLYQQALQAAEKGKSTTPPRLFISSTSLVTTGKGSKKEREMQLQQNKAFEALIRKAKGNVLELEVPGFDGQLTKVKFELKLATFNIPVNFGGVGKLQAVTSGRSLQRSMNKPAMTGLLGKGAELGGNTAHHLRGIDMKLNQLLDEEVTLPEERLRIKEQIEELTQQREIIIDLAMQIKDIYRTGGHHSEGHDTYKLAARVVYLTHLIGGVPMYNCKSGKDRTGMLDAEVKLLAARIDRDGKVPQPGKLSDEDKRLFRVILLNSGNHEVQKANVGVRGYKTELIDSIDERIDDPVVREEVRGLSKSVGF